MTSQSPTTLAPEWQPASCALAESGLPISEATMRRYLVGGRVAAKRIGRRWFTTTAALHEAFVQDVRPERATCAP